MNYDRIYQGYTLDIKEGNRNIVLLKDFRWAPNSNLKIVEDEFFVEEELWIGVFFGG